MQLRQPFSGDYPITLDFHEKWLPVYDNVKTFHQGIDYGCPEETPILAAADGWVLTVGYEQNGYGNYIIILHADNSGTVYAHLHSVATYLNAKVQKGDRIGYSGNTGNSSGPHLHFEYREQANKLSTAVDPKPYMQTVVDYVQTPVMQQPTTPVTIPPVQQIPINTNIYPQTIDGGLCEVICDQANIRDADTFMVKGMLYMGAKIVVSPDIVRFNGLPYHKICDDYLLIAEYDAYGTEILKRIE